MTIETDLFLVPRRGPNLLLKSDSIGANGSKQFDDPSPAKVLVISDKDGKGGAILIKNPKHVGVFFYENEEDEGAPIDPKKPIRLLRGQEAVIWSEKSNRELNIYIEGDDGDGLPIEPSQIIVNS